MLATCACGSSGGGTPGPIPVILYMHGGGWAPGGADTHDRLLRELAVGAGAAVAFVEYDRSPEGAIEQGYATAQWITREGGLWGLDPARLAVAGDSVGGHMAAALTLMSAERGDVRFVHQSLYHPVNDAYASLLRAGDEQLARVPPAFVLVAEADVQRDEGEAYAARLRRAGVAVTTVRYDAITD